MAASSAAAPKKARKVVAKTPFRQPASLPRHVKPPPPEEGEEMYNRVPEMYIRPGPMPPSLRQAADAAGLTFKPQLPDSLAHATHRQGRPRAEKLMRHTTEELVKKGVRFGTGEFDPVEDAADKGKEEKELVIRPFLEKEIRQAFNTYDLDGNDFIDAAELRHIFAQIGEMPSDAEISAMILLCDPRGDGTVNFDDFLNVFSNPAESLRNANIRGLKHLLPRKKIGFDIRDELGLTLQEKTRLKDTSLIVQEIRKGSQAQENGVKSGWKVLELEGEVVCKEKDFETKLKQIERGSAPDDDEPGALKSLNKKGGGDAEKKKQVKYDYSILFEVLPGAGDSSSSSSEYLEEEQDEGEDDDEDDEDA